MSEWIMCGERLPKYDQMVLTACRGALDRKPSHFILYLFRGKTDKRGEHWYTEDGQERESVTVDYWMPLPEPPA